MSKLQMNLEIMQALTFFGIDREYYSKLLTRYTVQGLHEALGEAFENSYIIEHMKDIVNN